MIRLDININYEALQFILDYEPEAKASVYINCCWTISCGKSTFVIRLLECKEQLCDIVFKNIVWCHCEDNAPHHLKDVSFFKSVPDFENPENEPTLIVLDDLMDSAYSKKVSEIFTKGSHHRNISLVMITQNLFHQGPSSPDIPLISIYIVVFMNPRDKTQIVQLARQVYPKRCNFTL